MLHLASHWQEHIGAYPRIKHRITKRCQDCICSSDWVQTSHACRSLTEIVGTSVAEIMQFHSDVTLKLNESLQESGLTELQATDAWISRVRLAAKGTAAASRIDQWIWYRHVPTRKSKTNLTNDSRKSNDSMMNLCMNLQFPEKKGKHTKISKPKG